MDSSSEIDVLVDEVRRGIGVDIYGLYEDSSTKRFLGEAILTSIMAALIGEYFKGFLGAKETGERRSKRLHAFFSGLRQDKVPDYAALKAQLVLDLSLLKASRNDSARQFALSSFTKDLEDAGVDALTAGVIAESIAASMPKAKP